MQPLEITNDAYFDAVGSQSVVYYRVSGQKIINGTVSSYGSTFANNDIIGIALDVTNGTVTYYLNGTSQGSITLPTGSYTWAFGAGDGNAAASGTNWNFGSPPYSSNSYTDGAGYGNFSYAVPSGYYALCSANLANFG